MTEFFHWCFCHPGGRVHQDRVLEHLSGDPHGGVQAEGVREPLIPYNILFCILLVWISSPTHRVVCGSVRVCGCVVYGVREPLIPPSIATQSSFLSFSWFVYLHPRTHPSIRHPPIRAPLLLYIHMQSLSCLVMHCFNHIHSPYCNACLRVFFSRITGCRLAIRGNNYNDKCWQQICI